MNNETGFNFNKIGMDVFIHDSAMIKHPGHTSIGSHVAIDNGVTITTKLEIGDYVHVAPYVCMIGGIESTIILEQFSFVAAGSKLVAGSEDYTGLGLVGPTIQKKYRSVKSTTIKFEKYSGCGVNCSIMPGITLAEGSILGANSLLTKDTEPWTIYIGSPAKPIKMRRKDIILNYVNQIYGE
jgi:acetyltransferase-like isoleucine patch superfamily enzyme